MSDDTTPPAPEENVVPFTPAAEASSADAPNQQDATDASSIPAAEQPAGPQTIQDAVAQVLGTIDMSTVSHHDVIHDLFRKTQDFAFTLMLAAKLFEQMLLRDSAGLKGDAFDLLRFANEEVTAEVHAILKTKVAVPVPTEVVEPA
jgi:hypothetical protein